MEEAFFCHKLFDTLLLHLHFHLPANTIRVQIDTRTLYDNLLTCALISYMIGHVKRLSRKRGKPAGFGIGGYPSRTKFPIRINWIAAYLGSL